MYIIEDLFSSIFRPFPIRKVSELCHGQYILLMRSHDIYDNPYVYLIHIRTKEVTAVEETNELLEILNFIADFTYDSGKEETVMIKDFLLWDSCNCFIVSLDVSKGKFNLDYHYDHFDNYNEKDIFKIVIGPYYRKMVLLTDTTPFPSKYEFLENKEVSGPYTWNELDSGSYSIFTTISDECDKVIAVEKKTNKILKVYRNDELNILLNSAVNITYDNNKLLNKVHIGYRNDEVNILLDNTIYLEEDGQSTFHEEILKTDSVFIVNWDKEVETLRSNKVLQPYKSQINSLLIIN